MTLVKEDDGSLAMGMSQASTNGFGSIQTAGNQFSAQVDGTGLAIGGRIFMQQTLTDDVKLTFTQLILDKGVTGNIIETTNSVAVKNSSGQVTGYKLTPTVSFLDVSLAYADRYALAPAGRISGSFSTSDSPVVLLGGDSPGNFAAGKNYVYDTTRQASFVSTLMYQAATGAPVPVAKINWSIGGRATFKQAAGQPAAYYLTPSNWILTTQTPTSGGVDQGTATKTFPTWTGNKDTAYQSVLQPKFNPR